MPCKKGSLLSANTTVCMIVGPWWDTQVRGLMSLFSGSMLYGRGDKTKNCNMRQDKSCKCGENTNCIVLEFGSLEGNEHFVGAPCTLAIIRK